MVSSMPGERSAARIGMLGNRARRVVATTPLPAPLSKALALGADRGDSSWTQDISSSAGGRVTYSARAAYAAEAVPQSSDNGSLDMNGEPGRVMNLWSTRFWVVGVESVLSEGRGTLELRLEFR